MSLNPCKVPDPQVKSILDNIPLSCKDDGSSNLNKVPFIEELKTLQYGLGHDATCHPLQSGKIRNDPSNPNRNVVNRYGKGLRGTDEAMKEYLSNIEVIAHNGKIHRVPVVHGTAEKAVKMLIDTNVRQDESLVVDRINLPIIAYYASDYTFSDSRYTYEEALRYFPDVYSNPQSTVNEKNESDTVLGFTRGYPIDIGYQVLIWTMYIEDMIEILTQIFYKTSKMGYLKVQGVNWEIPVKLTSILNNIDVEPGDANLRVVKYQLSFLAESYIPQPIVRRKSVLSINTDYVSGTNPDEIQEVITTSTTTAKVSIC